MKVYVKVEVKCVVIPARAGMTTGIDFYLHIHLHQHLAIKNAPAARFLLRYASGQACPQDCLLFTA